MTAATRRELLYAIRAEDAQFRQRMGQVNATFSRTERAAERAFKDIQQSAERAARRMRTDFDQANGHVAARFGQLRNTLRSSLAGFGVGAGAGLFAGFSAGSFISEINQAASSIADMNAEAERAGLTFEAFQELKFAFGRERVNIDALTDGFKELQLRADEFITTGKGPAAESFTRLGYNAAQLKEMLKDVPELLFDIIDRAQELDRAGQIRVFDELLGGTGGEQFVQLLDAGSEKLRESVAAAHRLGAVMSDEVAAKAIEVDREFQAIAAVVETRLKQGLVDVASQTLAIAHNIQSWVTAAENFLARIGNSEGFAKLNRILARQGLMNIPAGMTILDPNLRDALGDALDEQRSKVAELQARLAEADELAGLPESEMGITGLRVAKETAAALHEELAQANAALAAMEASLGQIPSITITPPSAPSAAAPLANVAGLNSAFESSLSALAAAAREAGHEIKVNSGFRTIERQAELFAAAVRKYGSEAEARRWVAPPGRSNHNVGLAADLGFGSDAARQWVHDNAAQFGLQFPLSNEDWHIESMGPDGGRVRGANALPVPADRRDLTAKADQERLELLKQQNAERERQQTAIDAVNESLAAQLEMAGLENEFLETGKLSLEEVNAALNEEQLVREKLNQLRAAGVDVTAEMEAAIRAEVAAVFDLKAANEDLAASQQRVAERASEIGQAFQAVGQPIADTFLDIISGAGNAEDAIKSLIKQLASLLIQGALFGSGPLGKLFGGGIFGSLFKFAEGGPVRLAAGGAVRGPGGPKSDAIPAMLSDGEFVVNARATRRYGGLLAAINAGRVPAFAEGGIATPARLLGGAALTPVAVGGGGGRIEIVSRFDADGGFQTAVERASRPVALRESSRAVRAGLDQYDRNLDRTILGKVDTAREKY